MVKLVSKAFWHDAGQAEQRLRGSYVMYDDKVVLIERINGGERDDISARIKAFPSEVRSDVLLSNPKFKRFRTLPPTGWVNCDSYVSSAVYLDRRPLRQQLHGLTDTSVSAGVVIGKELRFRDHMSFTSVVRDPGYTDTIKGNYPSLEQVLQVIQPRSTIAFSKKLAVSMDTDGIRWLFRNKKTIGLFPSIDQFMLLKSATFCKEELAEDASFTINRMMEF